MPDKKITREEIDEIYNHLRMTCQYLQLINKTKNTLLNKIREVQEILIDLEDNEE